MDMKGPKGRNWMEWNQEQKFCRDPGNLLSHPFLPLLLTTSFSFSLVVKKKEKKEKQNKQTKKNFNWGSWVAQ